MGAGAASGGGEATGASGRGGGRERGGRPATDGSDGSFGWWIAGLVLTALMVVLLIPVLSPERGRTDSAPGAVSGTGNTGAPPALGPAPNVDLSTMTPREAADRLFNRVMEATERGDSTEARNFLPMAISAYERARPLDADGRFHLSALLRIAGRVEEALETATEGLEEEPDHLLLLAAAAEAAQDLGRDERAEEHYGHLLEVWDEERARDREEYELHQGLLPALREDARAFLEAPPG